jgi:hypothetical protein
MTSRPSERPAAIMLLISFEAPDQRTAYFVAIETFNVPIERQNRLFVAKLSREEGAG